MNNLNADMAPGQWQDLLHTRVLGRHVIYEKEMGSTNQVLKAAALEGAPYGAVALCDRQTAGRGRLDRRWETGEPEGYLTLSLFVPKPLQPEETPLFTLLAGLYMAKAMEELGVPPKIKWPNDLVLGGKKVCGILCEGASDGVIIGLGVNVTAHPEGLDQTATHVSLYGSVTRQALLAAFLNGMEEALSLFEKAGFAPFLKAYEERLITLNQNVLVIGTDTYSAFATGVDASGGLWVQDEAGQKRLVRFGDVSVRGVMGYV